MLEATGGDAVFSGKAGYRNADRGKTKQLRVSAELVVSATTRHF